MEPGANRGIANESIAADFSINAAKNTIIYTLSKLYSSLLAFIAIIFLARYLGVTDFGVYTILFSFYVILGIGGSFGIGTAFRNKLVHKGAVNSIIINGYFIAIIFGVVVSIAGLLMSSYMASLYPQALMVHSNLLFLFEFTSIILFFFVLNNITISALVAVDKTKQASIANIIFASLQLTSIIILVLLGYNVFGALFGMMLGVISSFLIGFGFLLKAVKLKFIMPSKAILKNLLSYSFPVMVSNIAVLGVSSFSVIYLGIYVSSFVLGNYSAAFRFARIIETLILSTTFVLVPMFSNAFKDKNLKARISSIFNNSLYYMLLFILPIIVYLISSAVPLSNLIFSQQYSIAYLYFQIMILGFGLLAITNFSVALFVSYGDTKKFMLYQLAIVIIELALFIIITPFFKIMGALIFLFFIAPLISNAIFLKALSSNFSVKLENKIIKLLAPSIILFAVLYLIATALRNAYYTLIINLILIVILYPLLLVKFKLLAQKNIDFIRKLTLKLPIIGNILNLLLRYVEIYLNSA